MPTPAPRLVKLPGRDAWHIYHAIPGEPRRRVSTGCTDRTEAEAALARYIRDLAAPVSGPLAIAPLLTRYLADRRAEHKLGAERLEWAHKPLTRFWGTRPTSAVTADECRAYAARRVGEGVAASTVRTELQALRAALNWAADHGWCERTTRKALLMPPRPPPRERWLTRDEFARLLAHCHAPHLRLFCEMAIHTAARAGAILALTWDRVDLERRRIDFREPGKVQTRKRQARTPINDTLLPILQAAQERDRAEHVVSYGGARVGSIKNGFSRAVAAARLDGDVTPHTLRHTALTWLAQAGVSLWKIAEFAGHSDTAMIASTYGHWSSESMEDAARALG